MFTPECPQSIKLASTLLCRRQNVPSHWLGLANTTGSRMYATWIPGLSWADSLRNGSSTRSAEANRTVIVYTIRRLVESSELSFEPPFLVLAVRQR
jgi:hypothetical protein